MCFISKLNSIVRLFFDTLLILLVRKPVKKNGVAVIRLDGIGDFILWLDVAKEFRRLYPNDKITLICNQACESVAKLLHYWDDVIAINLPNFLNPGYRCEVLSKIRRRGFRTVIQTTFSRGFSTSDSLIRATGAKERIGPIGDLTNISAWKKKISDKWYTKLVPASPAPMMELQRNAEFMRELYGRHFTVNVPKLPCLMELSSRFKFDKAYFVLAPGASWSGRLWPVERFADVLTKIVASTGWLPVLCGSSAEKTLCGNLLTLAADKGLNIAGETSLPELVEVIRHAKILVGNESSFVHIAAAVGTPAVCILGGGHYGRFMPYVIDGIDDSFAPSPVIYKMECFGCNWQCTIPHERNKPMPCIERIKAESAMVTISKRLNNKN